MNVTAPTTSSIPSVPSFSGEHPVRATRPATPNGSRPKTAVTSKHEPVVDTVLKTLRWFHKKLCPTRNLCMFLLIIRLLIISRERYPPRKVVLQSTTVIPRIKFSRGPVAASLSSSKDSNRTSYFDVRVMEVGVICPAADLPESPTAIKKNQSGTVATTTGILVDNSFFINLTIQNSHINLSMPLG